MDNYNYPMGADTPDAPWNQREPEPIEVTCDVSFTLYKQVTVETTNYEIDNDFDGYKDINLLDSYKDIEELVRDVHYPVTRLLEELAKYIQGELTGGNISQQRKIYLKGMLEDCQGWQKEEIDIQDYWRGH